MCLIKNFLCFISINRGFIKFIIKNTISISIINAIYIYEVIWTSHYSINTTILLSIRICIIVLIDSIFKEVVAIKVWLYYLLLNHLIAAVFLFALNESDIIRVRSSLNFWDHRVVLIYSIAAITVLILVFSCLKVYHF